MSGNTRYPVPAHSRPSGRKRVSQVLSGLDPTAGEDATATPATVAAVPAVTFASNQTVTPATVSAVGAVPTANPLAAGIASPATVAAIGGVPPPTVAATAIVTPPPLAATRC